MLHTAVMKSCFLDHWERNMPNTINCRISLASEKDSKNQHKHWPKTQKSNSVKLFQKKQNYLRITWVGKFFEIVILWYYYTHKNMIPFLTTLYLWTLFTNEILSVKVAYITRDESPVRTFTHTWSTSKTSECTYAKQFSLIVHEEQFSLLHSVWIRKEGGHRPPHLKGWAVICLDSHWWEQVTAGKPCLLGTLHLSYPLQKSHLWNTLPQLSVSVRTSCQKKKKGDVFHLITINKKKLWQRTGFNILLLVSALQGYHEAAEYFGIRPVGFLDEIMYFVNIIEYASVQRKLKGKQTALEDGKVGISLFIVNNV